MSKINRGKDFEAQIRKAFEDVPNSAVVRLIDPQNGYAGVRNICDFIMYHKPVQYFIECKSCYGNTLPFTNITDNQWDGLYRMSDIDGVIAGVIVWFIDHDKTVFLPIQDLVNRKRLGDKSFNINKTYDFDVFYLEGKKRRILFDYDVTSFYEWGEQKVEVKYGSV